MAPHPVKKKNFDRVIKQVAVSLAVGGVFAFLVVFVYVSYFSTDPSRAWLRKIPAEHPATAIGVPLSAMMATCVVFLFKETSGAIEFEVWGFKLKGGSGPAIIWTIVFLAIALAMKILW